MLGCPVSALTRGTSYIPRSMRLRSPESARRWSALSTADLVRTEIQKVIRRPNKEGFIGPNAVEDGSPDIKLGAAMALH